MLSYVVLIPFFLVGCAFAWKRRQRAALVLASIVWSYALLRGVLGGNEAARLWIEPLFILLSFYGVKVLLDLRQAAGVPVEA